MIVWMNEVLVFWNFFMIFLVGFVLGFFSCTIVFKKEIKKWKEIKKCSEKMGEDKAL